MSGGRFVDSFNAEFNVGRLATEQPEFSELFELVLKRDRFTDTGSGVRNCWGAGSGRGAGICLGGGVYDSRGAAEAPDGRWAEELGMERVVVVDDDDEELTEVAKALSLAKVSGVAG